MKAYILTEKDIDKLLLMIDRDPAHGRSGGSSQCQVHNKEQQDIYDEAHRFYNYQVRTWIDEIKK